MPSSCVTLCYLQLIFNRLSVLVCSEVERQGILFFSFKILFSVLGDEPQFFMISWFSLLIVSLRESLEDAIGKQTVCGGWYSVTLSGIPFACSSSNAQILV